jgi:tripartite-type tricarboxylate transporter receptor subunit TctC
MKELGYPVVSSAFGGLFGPKGMPADVVRKVEAACEKVANDPRYQQKLRVLSQEPVYRNGADFAKVLAEDLAAKGDVVKRAGIKPNAN